MPLPPEVICSQPELLALAVHGQFVVDVVMVIEPENALAEMLMLGADNVKVHAGVAPACVTVNVFPPAVMVPVRTLLVVLAEAV